MGSSRQRVFVALTALIAVAIAVSVVHYTDNVLNFEDYPQPTSAPTPSATVIAAAWFVFTAAALAALAFFRRGRLAAASAALAVYSLSGLVGLGHYTVPGAAGMPWWRHAHIVADVLCGLAVLGSAVWVAYRLRRGDQWALGPARR